MIALFVARLARIALLALAGLCGFASAGHDDHSKADLRVTISARGRVLKTPVAPFAAEMRFVDTVVTNVSTKPQTIIAWTQYSWSWVSSSPQVSPDIEALKNASETVALEPGRSIARAVEVYVVGAQPVTFRLGFYPAAEAPVSASVPPVSGASITWSDTITFRH